jgi:hypothetical protein
VIVVRSRNGVAVRLTDERWGHISRRYPEMKEQKERVLETIGELRTGSSSLRILQPGHPKAGE